VPDGRERLTPRVRRVLAMAEGEAESLRLSEVGTEHVLLALLREGRGLATRALLELGVVPTELAQRMRARLVPADIAPAGPIGLGPDARAALKMAHAEAGRLHHDYLGTEHLLLGLLRNGEGPAFVVLNGAGVTLARARRQIVQIMNEAGEAQEVPGEQIGGLSTLRERRRPIDRLPGTDVQEAPPEAERCGHCGRARRAEWRFCAYCGERWTCCDRCDTPLPKSLGVRFCPGCGIMLNGGDRA
jgi:ATP-dependent Clp protease ATP-binding subunit ClpA